MENQEEGILQSLIKKTEAYIETSISLLKLKAIQKITDIISSIISKLIVLLLTFLFVIFLSIAIALWIGDMLGKYYCGFFIVAAFYGIIILVLYALRDKWIKPSLINQLIKKVLN